MGRLKRKASKSNLENSPKKKPSATMQVDEPISPTSKISIFKVDVFSCNGRDLSLVELAAQDLENIWKEGILRSLTELAGYTSMKVKNNSEIRIQYQLRKPTSIRDIALDAEFNFERNSAKGVEILKCRVVGLSNLREAEIGEKVKISVIKPNFDISPEQAIEWISHFGRVHEGHRYPYFCHNYLQQRSNIPLLTGAVKDLRDHRCWRGHQKWLHTYECCWHRNVGSYHLQAHKSPSTAAGGGCISAGTHRLLNKIKQFLQHLRIFSSYVKNSRGFNTPRYVVEVTLKEFVPEWIPMFGKRIRLYHHGMKKQCNQCFGLGHLKKDCESDRITWMEYVEKLRNTGKYEDQMFGSWLDKDRTGAQGNQGAQGKPTEIKDLRNYLSNPDNLKKALATYLEKNVKGNNNQSQHRDSRPRQNFNQNRNDRRFDNDRNYDNRQHNHDNERNYDNRPHNHERNSGARSLNRNRSRSPEYRPDSRKRYQNNRWNSYGPKKDRRM